MFIMKRTTLPSGGHAPEYVREAFQNAVEAYRDWRTGPQPWVPRLELPVYEDVFSIVNLDTSEFMPGNQRRAKLILSNKARVGSNGAAPEIIKLCEDIRNREPDTVIVSDRVREGDVPGVITHKSARGSNEFAGKPIAGVFMHLAPDQYRDLLLEDAQFGIRNAVRLHYLDLLDQTLGRTLGFRHQPGSRASVYMSGRLWKQIGMTLLTESRYEIEI
jgi:hypothetical protein